MGYETVADEVELPLVSIGRRCGGTRSVIYIERSETSYSTHPNLSVVIIQ
jgi:hypothetical protein